jgi:hypothetical protein
MIASNHRLEKLSTTALLAICLAAVPAVALAQNDPNAATAADTARLTADTARINAEAGRINAEAARDQARIAALHLPSFQGTTTLNAGAGAMEAAILTSHTVMGAAAIIKDAVDRAYPQTSSTTEPIIVLAGDEVLDFGRVGAINAEMDAIHAEFLRLLAIDRAAHHRRPPSISRAEAGGSATAIISAVTAAAGLLRSDTEVTALDITAISNRVLATAVATHIGARAILPAAAIGSIDDPPSNGGWQDMRVLQKLNGLMAMRILVEAARDRIPDASKPTQAAPYTAILSRFDAFVTRVTTADANGGVPIVQAARLSSLWSLRPRVLRVYVDKAGGSLIRTTNIVTTLALDSPVRVTGGLIATYTLTDPSSGSVLAGGIITCRTAMSRLREVQQGVWRNRPNAAEQQAQCAVLQAPA